MKRTALTSRTKRLRRGAPLVSRLPLTSAVQLRSTAPIQGGAAPKRTAIKPGCGKRHYKDEIAAKMALASTARQDGSRRPKTEKGIYYRAACKGWHLTSRRQREAARPADTGFSAAVKLAVRKRAGHGEAEDAICESCGVHLGTDRGQVHHRMDRQMGGLKLRNGIQNAGLMCGNPVDYATCHGKATRGDRELGPDAAGWWLEHGQNPALVPVIVHGIGMPVYLTATGGYSPDPPGCPA